MTLRPRRGLERALASSLAVHARALEAAARAHCDHAAVRARYAALERIAGAPTSLAERVETLAQLCTYALFVAWCDGDARTPDDARAWFAGDAPAWAELTGSHGEADPLRSAMRAIAECLCAVDRAALADRVRERAGRADLAADFYEPFFAEWNANERRTRGVFYTPAALVGYVQRCVRGLGADDPEHAVIVDLAAGTGAFIVGEAFVEHARTSRRVGFELSASAAAIASLLEQLRTPRDRPRVTWHVGNALGSLATLRELATSAAALIVIGNPPYAGSSANARSPATELVRGRDPDTGARVSSYFEIDGAPLGERNPKWLNDDYVKFVRVAQWAIEIAGAGALALVTNHGYLDHPTFRGMRASLLASFDEAWLLNLHGNSKRGATSPDGARDENVFDIQSGVAVSLYLRRRGAPSRRARVHYADLWGTRQAKLEWLASHDLTTTPWRDLAPDAPSFNLVPRDERMRAEYERGWKLTDAMPVFCPAVVTGRDQLVIDEDREVLRGRIARFVAGDALAETTVGSLDVDTARARLRHANGADRAIVRCQYRPFDVRWICYEDALIERSRRRVMSALLAPGNVALIARRQMLPGQPCTYFGVARHVVSDGAIRSDNHGTESVFPLRVDRDGVAPAVNFAPGFARDWSALGDPAPDDVLAFIYAMFHSSTYRERYAEFLREGYPRVFIPRERVLFDALRDEGTKLIALHLGDVPAPATLGYSGSAVPSIAFVRHADARVWINAGDWFGPVSRAAFDALIGGYAPCEKWLKDRRGRALDAGAIDHYRAILFAMEETLACSARIDAAIATHGGWPIATCTPAPG